MSDDWCVVGVTPAATAAGAPHLDGAACAMTADRVVAIAEERLARRRHAGGAELSLRAVLAEVGRGPEDVSGFFVSTCGEPPTGDPSVRSLGPRLHAGLGDLGVPAERVHWVPSHHLSHALSASLLVDSGVGLVLVADDAGSSTPAAPRAFERASAFRVRAGAELPRPLASIAAPEPGGLGSLYRVAAELAGFDGYTECGKATALAAFAASRPRPPRGRVVRTHQPLLVEAGAREALGSHLRGERGEEIASFGPRCWGQAEAELMGEAQQALEAEMECWLGNLLGELDEGGEEPARVVLAGGVALNCRLVGRLIEAGPGGDVRAFHAPGDEGQALGNALWGAHALGVDPPAALAADPFLGPRPRAADVDRAVESLAARAGFDVREPAAPDLVETVARTIARGGLVALYEGRSEYGPRALGHRSIVADPRSATMQARLNEVKGREPFRPFGLAVPDRCVHSLIGRPVCSPAMLAAVSLPPGAARAVPAGVHVDGTSRLQTLAARPGSLLASLLVAWLQLTEVPALINTSFNEGGKPLVETPAEAIEAAAAMHLDGLVLVRPERKPPFLLLSRT